MKVRALMIARSDEQLVSVVRRLALAIGFVVAAILPLGYFGVAYYGLVEQTKAEAEGKAGVISNLISSNPDLWTYEILRMEVLLARFPVPLADGAAAEVRDAKGQMLVRVGAETGPAMLARSHPLYESGRVVGQVQIARPVNRVLIGTAIATLLGVLLGLAVDLALRVLPLRALRRATGALRESEHKLNLALEASTLAVWEYEIATGDVSFSGHWRAMMGYSTEEIPDRVGAWEKLTHPDDVAGLRTKLAMHFKGVDAALSAEYRMLAKNGEWRWIRSVGQVVERDRAGRALRATGTHEDVTPRKQQEERLNFLAYYDVLTGLANRNLFHERLSRFLGEAKGTGRKLAVLMIDVERFRSINETLGRQAGDELLKQIAERARGHMTDASWLARIGADQFASIVPDMEISEVILRIQERLAQVLDAPFKLGGAEVRVSVKIGAALFPDNGEDADTLMRNAESALKKAKSSGERYLFYAPEMTAHVAANLALENRLRQALEKDEFLLHYQSKVDSRTGRIVGVEALVRWQSPETGLVPPGKFIPLMEETGMILEAGAWVLRRAVADQRRWAEMGMAALRVAVNVSQVQLRRMDFVSMVQQAIAEGVSPIGIDIEITESLMMDDIQGCIEKLKLIRSLGLGIAIDDFGTGHSSLAYLARLPVGALKIDRSFIVTMLNSPDTMALVSTMISLAHSLRLKVIAEGVEAEEQAKILRLLRCDEMQGYLFSRPVPFDEMTALLMLEAKERAAAAA